jgi:hypothetical protein
MGAGFGSARRRPEEAATIRRVLGQVLGKCRSRATFITVLDDGPWRLIRFSSDVFQRSYFSVVFFSFDTLIVLIRQPWVGQLRPHRIVV